MHTSFDTVLGLFYTHLKQINIDLLIKLDLRHLFVIFCHTLSDRVDILRNARAICIAIAQIIFQFQWQVFRNYFQINFIDCWWLFHFYFVCCLIGEKWSYGMINLTKNTTRNFQIRHMVNVWDWNLCVAVLNWLLVVFCDQWLKITESICFYGIEVKQS